VNVEEVKSINHRVKMTRPQEGRAHVELAEDDKIPNKDFVLRYKVAGKTVKSALMAQRDTKGDGGYFTLMLVPPESLENLPRKPLEMVFTLDVSGSMSGRPIEQSKAAVRYALKNMRSDDTFNVVRFFQHAEQFAPRAVPANEQTIPAAMQYIEQMQAGGGTMMIQGIRQSLQVTPDPDRLRFVAFLTDGFIGNEEEILREIHNLRGSSRIFSFGVGQAPNRYLLDHMARMGQGCAAYLSLNDEADDVMAQYFARISHPALTDLAIDWGGMQVSDVYPAKLPDLFVGRPLVVTGRYHGNPDSATVRVRGKVGGETREMPLAVDIADAKNAHAGIASVWARMKISDLGDRATYENNPELAGLIKQTALDYGLMSAFTAFVAVDSSQRTAGDHGTTVMNPVPVPEGVRYDTTVPQ
jgi:Ca-activated chloride channel family protein